MTKLEKIKELSERLTNFLKRKRTKLNVVININEGNVSEETRKVLIEEMEKYLRGAGHRKMIQLISR